MDPQLEGDVQQAQPKFIKIKIAWLALESMRHWLVSLFKFRWIVPARLSTFYKSNKIELNGEA